MYPVSVYFNPRSPQGGATPRTPAAADTSPHFNPRSPQGGATCALTHLHHTGRISIHAPRKGERLGRREFKPQRLAFQSTLPARGSDPLFFYSQSAHPHFNPRSPQGGATSAYLLQVPTACPFQSTLPARGSDPLSARWIVKGTQISIHAPRKGERPTLEIRSPSKVFISIHAPRKGERLNCEVCVVGGGAFQSTLPARGSDLVDYFHPLDSLTFQSTLPARGSDQKLLILLIMLGIFQSTLPARGSDNYFQLLLHTQCPISIHAPRKGERLWEPYGFSGMVYFNPRSPQGGATFAGL